MKQGKVDADTFQRGMDQLRREEPRFIGGQRAMTVMMNDALEQSYRTGQVTELQASTLANAAGRFQ